MQREYGIDLLDLWRGTLSLRKVKVLIDNLPADSRAAYRLAGQEYAALAGWRLTDLLLGRLSDELALYRWEWEAAHLDPKKTQHRKQPPSVLPELKAKPSDPNRIPVVRPSALGGFVNDRDLEVIRRGN